MLPSTLTLKGVTGKQKIDYDIVKSGGKTYRQIQ